MTNLDNVLKRRDVTLPTKVRLVKAMIFPAVMYGCESWTIKKAEHRGIDAFELWCWRRLLKVKEESEKNWLKTQHSKNCNHSIQSHNFMERVRYFNCVGSEIHYIW